MAFVCGLSVAFFYLLLVLTCCSILVLLSVIASLVALFWVSLRLCLCVSLLFFGESLFSRSDMAIYVCVCFLVGPVSCAWFDFRTRLHENRGALVSNWLTTG